MALSDTNGLAAFDPEAGDSVRDQAEIVDLPIHRPDIHNVRLTGLTEIGRALSCAQNLDHCLAMIVELTTDLFEAERSSIFLHDARTDELVTKVAKGLRESAEIRIPAGSGLAGHVFRTSEVINIPDAYNDPRFHKATDDRTGYHTRSVMAAPLPGPDGSVLGVIQVLNRKDGQPFLPRDEYFLEGVAGQCAVALTNSCLLTEIDNLFDIFIEVASAAIDQRDPNTAGHSRRVTLNSLNLARAVDQSSDPAFADRTYSRSQLRQLRYAGLLHDFGKIGVREAVLCKSNKLHPGELMAIVERIKRIIAEKNAALLRDRLRDGTQAEGRAEANEANFREHGAAAIEFLTKLDSEPRITDADLQRLEQLQDEGLITETERGNLSVSRGNLNDEEWTEIQSHVSKSYHLLKLIPWPESLKEIPDIAHGHHEKLDGSGYPNGLKDEEIHFDSKILAIADIYDALTSNDRPYKKAIPHDQAMRILYREADQGKLDRRLVELFDAKQCYRLKNPASEHGSNSRERLAEDRRNSK